MFNLIEIKKKNICIMGLMGSGKSIFGKDLSKYSNLKFYEICYFLRISSREHCTSRGKLMVENLSLHNIHCIFQFVYIFEKIIE